MERKQFARSLQRLSKTVLTELVSSAGLKQRDERIILAWYVKEHTIYKIATDENITKESAYNALSAARNRLFDVLSEQGELLPETTKKIINFLTNKG